MTPQELGAKVARKLFERRGNHSEVHLSEAELAELLAGTVSLAEVITDLPRLRHAIDDAVQAWQRVEVRQTAPGVHTFAKALAEVDYRANPRALTRERR